MRQRLVLALFQNFHQVLAAIELVDGSFVEVAAELREGRQRPVLRQVETQAAGDRLHGLGLRVTTHAADRDAHVDGRPHVGVEEVGLQEDLAIGDRDHVGGDVRRNVAGLGFDERQRGERSAAQFVVQLGGALQQAAVEVEHVAREGLASRRTAQKERNLAIRRGVLGKIVVDAQRVALVVAEILAHGAPGERRQVLHGGGIGSRRQHHDGVLHGAVLFQGLHHLGDGGALLPDGDVDADHVAALLVDDGVDGDGGLAGLAVADDQFALSAADGNHAVDGLDAGLQRFLHRLAGHHAGRQALDGIKLVGGDGPLIVDGLAERVDHAADERFAHGDGHDAAGAPYFVAFLNFREIAQQHRADLVFFQVHGDARDAVRKLDQLAGHHLFEAMDSGDAVAHGDHRADLGHVDRPFVMLDLLAQNLGNFVRSNLSHKSFPFPYPWPPSRPCNDCNWPRRLPS